MRAREVMSSPPITCHVNDPLNTAAARMWDGDVGVLPVVNDDGKLTGVITDRDICMAALTQGNTLDAMLVNSAMAKHAVSAHADASLAAIEQLMATHQIRRVPIVDETGKPIGVVSLNDLALASVQPDAAMNLTQMLAAICRPHPRSREVA